MTKKQVWQYKCEFCGKRGYSAGHMRRHEAGCTANPERACRMHAYFETPQIPVADLRKALDTRLPDCGMAELRRISGGCPMCMLAAIRQSEIQTWDGDAEHPPRDLGFDFKAELKAAWAGINERGIDYGVY
jgi:hypothetical protein